MSNSALADETARKIVGLLQDWCLLHSVVVSKRHLEDEGMRSIAAAIREAEERATLFKSGGFTLHSGAFTSWLIDCAALTDADLSTLAFLTVSLFGAYGEVEGVPEGGLRFARELRKFTTVGPLLIADDVLTTGASMEAQRDGRKAKGVVIFARGPCPTWVTPLFSSTA